MGYSHPPIMIFGANGYSARLIIDELVSRNVRPILAGRNETAIKELAEKYGVEFRIFDLSKTEIIIEALQNVHTLLNCAGPFRYTAKELMEACLQTKTNYLDITGEIPVLHLAFSFNQKAKEAGITILPSVGFDIIPTDCLAKKLSEQMPDATHLKLGFLNKRGKISRGTLLTTLEFLGGKGYVRKNSNMVESKIGEYVIKIRRENFSFNGISIPWGDVYSSYYSTGIPNVEVYLGIPLLEYFFKPVLLQSIKLFKRPFIKQVVSAYIKKNLTGPSKRQRDSTETYVWGRVENAKGEILEEAYQFMEGYNLTAKGAAEVAVRVLNNSVSPGTYTPSLAFGGGFMEMFVIKKIL